MRTARFCGSGGRVYIPLDTLSPDVLPPGCPTPDTLLPLDTLPLPSGYSTPIPCIPYPHSKKEYGTRDTLPPRKDMRQEICYPTPWTEQRALVKTIPSRNFVGGRYKNPPEQRAICTAQAEGFAIGDSEVVVKNKATI